MTTEDDFNRLLDANPDDHQTRLVFADWLEDRGDSRAAGYRALGEIGLRPSLSGSVVIAATWGGQSHPYRWIDREWASRNTRWLLPTVWFIEIPFREGHDWAGLSGEEIWKYFDNRREAEDAAALAFARLPHELQLECLKERRC